MDNGRELMSLLVLPDGGNWVAWMPEGYYASTADAGNVLQWHINDSVRGLDAVGATVPVSAIQQQFHRPEILALVLQQMDTVQALGIADLTLGRKVIQRTIGATTPPGARLHVLTIGINEYGDKAKHLRLRFARSDAEALAVALGEQGMRSSRLGSLYADVKIQSLRDQEADKGTIYQALATIRKNIAQDETGQDFVVIMFSGHGAMIDDQFYLLPYGVDARTPELLRASAISVSEFRNDVAKLAQSHRVLVLLDACHSGAVASDGSQFTPNADVL